MTHPSQVTVSGEEYLDWCRRAKAGEVTILSVVVLGASYRLNLLWPSVAPAVQKELL
jgi:hypothetical protein